MKSDGISMEPGRVGYAVSVRGEKRAFKMPLGEGCSRRVFGVDYRRPEEVEEQRR